MKKWILSSAFLLWMTVILGMFYVVQKPDFLQIPRGLANLLLTVLLPLWMAVLSAALGFHLLSQADPAERVTIGTALGLSLLGLTGFGLGMVHLTSPITLLAILIVLTGFFLWQETIQRVWADLRQLGREVIAGTATIPAWIPGSA